MHLVEDAERCAARPTHFCITGQIVQAVKNAGAVAAIIGVLEGQVHVGMSERDIDKLVADKRPDAVCYWYAMGHGECFRT